MNIKDKINNIFNDTEISNLFLGIMLGYTDELDEDIKNNFKNSSISHILAVSGMHISYIILGITFLFKKNVGKKINKFIIIFILIVYMFITGFTPSVVRAGLMGIINI